MYRNFFKLDESPFWRGEGDAYYFAAHSHENACSYIDFLFHDGDGIGVITGEPGVGKTAALDRAVDQRKDTAIVASMQQTGLSTTEFLLAICTQLKITPKEVSTSALTRELEQFGRRQQLRGAIFTVAVDDAHELPQETLKTLLTLAGVEKNGLSKLNLLLVGRPELMDSIETDDSLPADQQVRFTYALKPFQEDELQRYVEQCIERAGAASRLRLRDDAYSALYRFTGGVPGLIGVLGDHVLFEAFERHLLNPDGECVLAAAEKLGWPPYVNRDQYEFDSMASGESTHKIPPVGAKLIVRNNGEVVSEHPLKKERVLLGRQSDKDVLIKDKRVSREHAQIVRLNDEFYLQDLNSSNGTFLGKRRIKWHTLQNGDVFRIGRHEIEYVEHVESASEPAPSIN